MDAQEVRKLNIENPRKDIDLEYLEYEKKVNLRNGNGRVIYFDLVMIAEACVNY